MQPVAAPSPSPTAVCGSDVLDAWGVATSFEDGWGEWAGGEEYSNSKGWHCDGGELCWSRARSSNADGSATGVTAASDGTWWAFVESSNDAWQSRPEGEGFPGKTFRLASPPYFCRRLIFLSARARRPS